MDTVKEKKIDYRFKILYAVGAIMICCKHTSGGGINLISDWFPYGGLHLPLFVFGSGYFYNCSSEDNLKAYIGKKTKKLLIPLYIYYFVYGILVQLLKLCGFEIGGDLSVYNLLIAPITDGHQFVYNLGGWFIAPFFMVEIFNVLIHKLLHKINKNIPEAVFFAVSIALGIMGNQMACMGITYGGWIVIVRMLYFLPFFELGIFYKSFLEKYDRKIPSFWYFVAVFGIKLLIIYRYGRMVSYTPSWCNNFYEGPVMPIIIGITGIALWLRIATILSPVIGKSKWINLIADNTYSIMMNQFLGYMIVKGLFGLIGKVYSGFADFDWISFKTDIWYYYLPKGLAYFLPVYVIGGIAFSILVQKAITHVGSKRSRNLNA